MTTGAPGFSFVLDEELSQDDLVALSVTMPTGQIVQLWAEVALVERMIILRQFAIHGVNLAAWEIGPAALRALAQAAMEDFDVNCIRIEEARRVSGANLGRVVKSIEFRRRAN